MKAADQFPLNITEKGVSARIRRASQIKHGKAYESFVVEYVALGVRRRVWRSDLDDAKAVARDACHRISNGERASLQLKNGELFSYTRAVEILSPLKAPIDAVAREWADAMAILGGNLSIIEACRAWVKSNSVQITSITVADAAEQLKKQAEADGKSKDRQKQLAAALDALAAAFCVEVQTITPDLISRYLIALPFVDRTKANHRDVIKFFNRWLILRGYLAKGTDWCEGLQKYSKRKISEIQIYAPKELTRLLSNAGDMTPFVAIGAFAGLRHAEIARLDWNEIEFLTEAEIQAVPIEQQWIKGWIEVKAAKSKTGERRLVPIHANLKAWLLLHRPPSGSGKVVAYANTTKQLLKVAKATGRAAADSAPEIPAIVWKHNALRHSFISYRVSECADVPRVSDEAGNSPAMIRQHYLRCVKPAQAAEWFSIFPQS